MMLSDLDGFLHGIVCSPVPVPSKEWLPVALGGSPDEVPDWVLQSIMMIHDSIIQGLTFAPPEVEPIFWKAQEGHVIAMDWCEGFMQALSLRPKQWLRLTESGTGGQLITPIMVHLLEALLHKSCLEDSPYESSVIAGIHEQLDPYELQDQKLVTL